jgi:hypothetical protein
MNFLDFAFIRKKVEFSSCIWCDKIYRVKKGWFTGVVFNRKYCSNYCKCEAEGRRVKSYGLKVIK